MTMVTVLFALFLLVGFASVGWHLWRALRTGEVSEQIWFGARADNDLTGFVLRVIGLVVMLGLLAFAATQLPALLENFEGQP